MNIKKIKVGQWYETTLGYGEAIRVGGTFPPSVKFRITAPFPRGLMFVAPKDVLREATQAEAEAQRIDVK